MELSLNAQRFSGSDYVTLYDRYRPSPPSDLLQQAIRYTRNEQDVRVVDLGCGTGISTLAWSGLAEDITGVEPSEAMLDFARRKLSAQPGKVSFLQAYADHLPFSDQSIDIVSCSQSFHWMEPVSTLKEANRVLRPGGVFVIYDCGWPPSCDWQAEQAYRRLFQGVSLLSEQLEGPKAVFFAKDQHLQNITDSGYFSFIKVAQYHQVQDGGPERLIGLARSQGGLEALFKKGYSEEETGWVDFVKSIGLQKKSFDRMTFHYSVIYAVKTPGEQQE
ncbi:MAG: class I SAM-dependent methyltransferase [Saprospiraceae bacterium]|nr:class I SAM-dependent methyltransferase [Lewinella sp.]